jgi:hypothetical protein
MQYPVIPAVAGDDRSVPPGGTARIAGSADPYVWFVAATQTRAGNAMLVPVRVDRFTRASATTTRACWPIPLANDGSPMGSRGSELLQKRYADEPVNVMPLGAASALDGGYLSPLMPTTRIGSI